uniref:hypothetical protein n=1 Tax=Pseudomonas mucidolens TaxID=46679 RepID=UPI0035A24B40
MNEAILVAEIAARLGVSTHSLYKLVSAAPLINLGSRFHVVAVPADLAKEAVQTFKAFTADLERMATWLTTLGITTVAMESTGVYWISVYEILEAHGLHGRTGQCPRCRRGAGTQNRCE